MSVAEESTSQSQVTPEQIELLNFLHEHDVHTKEDFDNWSQEAIQMGADHAVDNQDEDDDDDDSRFEDREDDSYDERDYEAQDDRDEEIRRSENKRLDRMEDMITENSKLIKKIFGGMGELHERNEDLSDGISQDKYSAEVLKALENDKTGKYKLMKNILSNPERNKSKFLLDRMFNMNKFAEEKNKKLSIEENMQYFENDLQETSANLAGKDWSPPKATQATKREKEPSRQQDQKSRHIDDSTENTGSMIQFKEKQADMQTFLNHDQDAEDNYYKHFGGQ